MLSESTICLFHPTQIIVTRFLFMDNLWLIYGQFTGIRVEKEGCTDVS